MDGPHTASDNRYRIDVQPLDGPVVARHGSAVIAESVDARVMRETRLPATVYFPMQDVRARLVGPTGHRTFCPFKGTATYWDVEIDGRTIPNGAWSYRNALPEARAVEGLIGFMPDAATALEAGSGPIESSGDGNVAGPTVDWLLREAWLAPTPEALTEALANRFLSDGIAIARMSVMIWSLHPQIVGRNYVWEKATSKVASHSPSYALLDNPAYRNSPLRHVTAGQGGVRQRLTVDDAEFAFPVMDDLKAKGCTDYVAMPLPFSDGRINVLTLACDHPDGFTTANLGLVFECSTVISRFYEVFTLKDNATTLLSTYLGPRTGARVLGGEIRRGDGDEIEAAVLMCDLRDSTRWEAELGRRAYLDLLNRFFETATEIVNENEGEVLKFIGDAVLAIFPAAGDAARACDQAVRAANAIARTVAEVEVPGRDTRIGSAIGVAFGDVTYGNVGSTERLDFTVIGAAANLAARLGELGKRLGHPVVASEEVAAAGAEGLTPVGRFDLHGVPQPVEAFAPGT